MPTAYVTAPPDAAADLARTLVEERLAACVNRVPCESIYRWEGTVHEDDEVVLFVKTTADRYEDLVERLHEVTPTTCPVSSASTRPTPTTPSPPGSRSASPEGSKPVRATVQSVG